MDIDLPAVVLEVEAAFAHYEEVLRTNDIDAMGALFWKSDLTIRYGMGGEIGHGWDEIQSHRKRRSSTDGPWRRLSRTVITTFGRDFATASTLFYREEDKQMVGRQMQTWARINGAWQIVAAHVSWVPQL